VPLELTPQQRELQMAARSLAENVLKPRAAEIDRTAVFPTENLRAMAELGFCGMSVPKEYGGTGLDALTICLITEELARGCPSSAGVLMAFVVGIQPIVQFGSHRQKETFLPGLAAGRKHICFCVTEEHAGSDVAAIRTHAVRRGDHWVVNGHKTLIGNAAAADLCILAAKTDPEAGHKGVSVFLVPKAAEGVRLGTVYDKFGMRGTNTAELFFENVVVRDEDLLGDPGKGSHYLLKTLDLARLTVAAEAIGMAQAAFDSAVEYSKTRITFGKTLSNHQAIQFKLADMATEIHAARLMMYEGCRLYDQGRPFNKEASMAKLYASEMASRVTSDALQIHGGRGFVGNGLVQRLFRDSRYTEIWEGTSEIQRIIIARCVLDSK
jgi:butyryl-CoA dehydrogenase